MVFFTCSHCGDSIKKPSVEKHYQTKCRYQTPFLTCVDCLKDFKGNEYDAHTKCFTEEQRYSAKGFVPKPSANKGEKKQKAWSECVQGLLSTGNLEPDERNILQTIVKFENIPRKKPKFINFLNTTAKIYKNRTDLIDRLWDKIENYFKEANAAVETQQKSEPGGVNGAEGEKVDGEKEESKKKKKRKHEEAVVEPEVEDKPEKKKKKKKKHSEEANENGCDGTEGKVDEVQEPAAESVEEPKKKKKKKKKKEENANEGPSVNGKEENTKTKDEKMEVDDKENVQGEGDKKEASEGAFDWADAIVKALSTDNADGRVSLKKLQKKVLKKYCKAVGCGEADEKTVKKFGKKLKKVNGVVVEGEFVTLKR